MDGDSDEGVNVVGYIQPQFNYFLNGNDDDGNALKPSTFEFKRARIGVVGSFDVSYYVMAELSPTVDGTVNEFDNDAILIQVQAQF